MSTPYHYRINISIFSPSYFNTKSTNLTPQPKNGSTPHHCVNNIPFKVAVSRDFFGLFLFYESKPPGPLINGPNWFAEKFVFAKMFEFTVSLKNSTTSSVSLKKCPKIMRHCHFKGFSFL